MKLEVDNKEIEEEWESVKGSQKRRREATDLIANAVRKSTKEKPALFNCYY